MKKVISFEKEFAISEDEVRLILSNNLDNETLVIYGKKDLQTFGGDLRFRYFFGFITDFKLDYAKSIIEFYRGDYSSSVCFETLGNIVFSSKYDENTHFRFKKFIRLWKEADELYKACIGLNNTYELEI